MCKLYKTLVVLIIILNHPPIGKAQECGKLTYKGNVGDIQYNAETDRADFEVSSMKIKQYYNFSKATQIKGEKIRIYKYFKVNYDTTIVSNDCGYITIRFIVNIKGETGWFRVQEMDENYRPKSFDHNIVDQILQLTIQLDGWKTGVLNGETYDYYQYLVFKIENGLIKEIMP